MLSAKFAMGGESGRSTDGLLTPRDARRVAQSPCDARQPEGLRRSETRAAKHPSSPGIVMIPPQFGDDTPRTDTCIWSCISMYLGRIPQVGRVLCDPHMIHVSPHLMHAVEASSRYIQNTFMIHLEKRRSMLQYMLAEIHQYHTQY